MCMANNAVLGVAAFLVGIVVGTVIAAAGGGFWGWLLGTVVGFVIVVGVGHELMNKPRPAYYDSDY